MRYVSCGDKHSTDFFIDLNGRYIMITPKESVLIQKIVLQYGPKHVYSHIKFKEPELYRRIIEYNKHEERKISFVEQLYRYLHGLQKNPGCEECGGSVHKFYGYDTGYATFCSRKCVADNKLLKAKKKKTLHQKYGVDSPVEVRWKK